MQSMVEGAQRTKVAPASSPKKPSPTRASSAATSRRQRLVSGSRSESARAS